MSKEAFKSILFNCAENMVIQHKRKIRQKQVDLINYKLHGDTKYQEKNGFFEFQIEN